MADKIAGSHNRGKLGEENQNHRKGTAANGILRKAFIRLILHLYRNNKKNTANYNRQNPKYRTHTHTAIPPFLFVLVNFTFSFLYGIMVQVRFPYVRFSARGRPLKRYCSFTTKYGPPGDLFARSKIPQGSPI